MDRAAKLIRDLKLGGDAVPSEALAIAAWPGAVGKRIAAWTEARSLVRGTLVVAVTDGVWQKQLWSLRHQILANLERNLGAGIVSDLDFRLSTPPRRGVARETAPVRAADDADAIADPVLSRIYKNNRKRATF